MEYYSAIKKKTFESVLMRWMKLKPNIQSEVSHKKKKKKKQQYSILMPISCTSAGDCDGAQAQTRGATPCPRSGAAAKRSNPTSKERWLHGHRKAERSYPSPKVRGGGRECQAAWM